MEQWKRWIPLDDIPSTIYNDMLLDGKDGVILEFSDENGEKKVVVNFKEGVLSYRNTDEGSLLETLNYLDQYYGTDFYSDWSLFKVKNSEYLKWFHKESCGIYESREVEHYVFLTSNDVIEILSIYPPSITVK
ncbi:hypothetical protein ACTHHL_06005 [Aeribacillus composti]|uniref:Uncharacterized protein n=2 Tax=Aeribacillus TaxID=1055323 RepID=A0A223E292_9BACI|nr:MULTISPECIES: hypothetical protein [Aeribacillus]ASS89275.1 hypothetical protein AP3564_02540 [Aeribacillus pallidus]REJ23683.1 MAG: hypothetical protein C6W54_10925 [Bacillaceae bacterium]TVZ86034.1 hypothetical protein FB379_10520 [Aeribacillus composti]WNF32549.1 hypothetical protein RI196_14945 [Aeribacillus composti]